MSTVAEKFRKKWPQAFSEEPWVSALINPDDIQSLADETVIIWNEDPKIYIINVRIGSEREPLLRLKTGKKAMFKANFPGLQTRKALQILGRSGESINPTSLTLYCFGK